MDVAEEEKIVDIIMKRLDEIPLPIPKGTWEQICDENEKKKKNLEAIKNSDINAFKEANKVT